MKGQTHIVFRFNTYPKDTKMCEKPCHFGNLASNTHILQLSDILDITNTKFRKKGDPILASKIRCKNHDTNFQPELMVEAEVWPIPQNSASGTGEKANLSRWIRDGITGRKAAAACSKSCSADALGTAEPDIQSPK